MKKEVFELLLAFHLKLIRKKPNQSTIDDAFSILVHKNGPAVKGRRNNLNLAENLRTRQQDLLDFYNANWDGKVKAYGRSYVRKPDITVFNALKLVIDDDEKLGVAARLSGCNFQSVKVLKPRFDYYVDTAGKLNTLLN